MAIQYPDKIRMNSACGWLKLPINMVVEATKFMVFKPMVFRKIGGMVPWWTEPTRNIGIESLRKKWDSAVSASQHVDKGKTSHPKRD
jgi:hypothetical protein